MNPLKSLTFLGYIDGGRVNSLAIPSFMNYDQIVTIYFTIMAA